MGSSLLLSINNCGSIRLLFNFTHAHIGIYLSIVHRQHHNIGAPSKSTSNKFIHTGSAVVVENLVSGVANKNLNDQLWAPPIPGHLMYPIIIHI